MEHRGSKATADGWLNRALQAEDVRHRQEHTAFRAFSLLRRPGANFFTLCRESAGIIALNNVNGFTVAGRGPGSIACRQCI